MRGTYSSGGASGSSKRSLADGFGYLFFFIRSWKQLLGEINQIRATYEARAKGEASVQQQVSSLGRIVKFAKGPSFLSQSRFPALTFKMGFEIPGGGTDVIFNGQSPVGQRSSLSLGARDQHVVVISCQGGD